MRGWAWRGQPERSRGQSLVELAIILPVLLLLVLAALDLGRVFLGWVVLNNAARVGANYAALHAATWGSDELATYENLVADARDDAAVALAGCDSEAIPAPSFPNGTSVGDFAEVVLDCDFQPITPIIGNVFSSTGNRFTVSARSVFPIRSGLVTGGAATPPDSCLADFSWVPLFPVVGQPVVFTDLTPPPATLQAWAFGDGGGAVNVPSPSHTYEDADQYDVTLSSSSGGTPCTPRVVTLAVSELPPGPPPPPENGCLAWFAWDPVLPVVDQPVDFTDLTTPAASEWSWTFGDGGSANTATPSHTYVSVGNYTVRLESSDGATACDPYDFTITVSEPPEVLCPVPLFEGTQFSAAQDRWEAAGFSTEVDIAPGDKKNQDWTIQWQSIVGGLPVPCNDTITVSASEPKKP